jgi:hypothetical protein
MLSASQINVDRAVALERNVWGYLVARGFGAFGNGGGVGSDAAMFVGGFGFGGSVAGPELSRRVASAVKASNKLRTVQSCANRYSSASLDRSAEPLSMARHNASESLSLRS